MSILLTERVYFRIFKNPIEPLIKTTEHDRKAIERYYNNFESKLVSTCSFTVIDKSPGTTVIAVAHFTGR